VTQTDPKSATHGLPVNAVAIVGMAGRFPDAPDLPTFWRNLTGGHESLTPLSDEELLGAGVSPELIADPSYVKKATYLEGADRFDAAFFGFNAREAEILDPQQRVFLECAWEAMEDSGYVPDRFPGKVGVFAGASMNSYLISNLLANPAVLQTVGGYQAMISSDKDFLATRVSYKLNLRGPGITVQTACSTSLVAVQMACQSLLNGQCGMALAGGVSIGFPAKVGYLYQDGMIFSPDGHCRPFDARGRGIRGGAGAGIVVLKRLADAVSDGDNIRAVILGAAVNNDGAGKIGYTAPSIDGQADAIAAAQAMANVAPDSISYIEAHGTATPLGDPIEVAALSKVFRAATSKRHFCALGSVKSNIGHLDAAAGIVGVIKTALSLENRTIPASLNFEKPNPEIDFEASPFYVNASLAEWKTDAQPRRAGVSSFGIGGTNAHAILEEAPPRPASVVRRPEQLLVLSARSATALDASANRLAAHLRDNPGANLADVAYTLQVGRKRFDFRRAMVARDASAAIATLTRPDTARPTAAVPPREPAVAFMFSGQGSQYAGMGRGLYDSEPIFRAELDRCAEQLQEYLGRDIRELILNDASGESELNQTGYAQPALFAFEYAVARMLMVWGVRPSAMIGHSIGEYVAACLAGVLSLDDALRLVAERGRLMQAMPAGRMLAVPLSEAEVAPLLDDTVSLAAVNAPRLCVVAGPSDAITTLQRKLGARGIECRALHTSHAFHSAMMDPAIPPFLDAARGVTLSAPTIPYISNRTGTWATADDVARPEYWAGHLRGTVRFADGLAELARIEGVVLVEVGPGTTLTTLARQTVAQSGTTVIGSGRHPLDAQSDGDALLAAVGQLWSAGVEIDWNAFHAGERLHRVSLPTYPFERQRYMVDPEPASHGVPDALAKKTDVADWFYVPSWKRVPGAVETGESFAADNGAWLVFLDDAGVAERIVERARASGQRCVTVRRSDSYHADEDAYAVRPQVREDYDALVAGLTARGIEIARVVHAWNVTSQSADPALDSAMDAAMFSLISLMQAVGESPSAAPRAVVVLANGLARVIGHEQIAPVKSLLLGPVRSIPHEFPGVVCQSLDIDLGEANAALCDELALAVSTATKSGMFAYRGGRRWEETYEPMPLCPGAGAPSSLRTHGVYVITGGLGGLGLLVARYLATTVNARLVLTARSPLPARDAWAGWLASHDDADLTARRIRAVNELEAMGAEVLVLDADAGVAADMERVATAARERFGTVNGVFHAAGVPGGGMLQLLSRDATLGVLSPKVHGTLILDSLFPESELLVLFSSINALVGVAGATDYASANAFLDAFANARNTETRRVLSIDWDAWSEVGMAAARAAASPGNATSATAIAPREGIDALDRALRASAPQVAVITRDLPALVDAVRAGVPAQRESGGQTAADAPALSQHARPEMDQSFVEPRDDRERIIAGIWREMLGLDRVGIDDNFFELGGHSLIATGLLARIHKEFHVKPPLRVIFDAPTVRLLSERVAELSWATQQPSAAAASEDGREEFEI